MKTLRFIKAPALALLFAMAACSKSNNNATTAISNDDAATIMANSMASSSGGFVSAQADVTVNAQLTFAANPGCGGTKTYSFSRSNPQGSSITYNYAFNYTYTLNCVNNIPDNVSTTANSTGSFDGPNLSSNDTGSSTFTVGGLPATATNYTLNGEYKRTGSFTQKTGGMNKGSSNVDIIVSNVVIPKTSNIITSGTATFTLGGTTNNGVFSITGNITFIGNNQANLTINGVVYAVNLLTGTATHS